MNQRVLVCGGRDYNDAKWVYSVLDQAHEANPIVAVISGMARGADSIGAAWANDRHIPVDPYPAAWEDLSHPDALIRTRADGKKYDARAGHRRNQKMLDQGRPDVVIAFPGGGGTDDMVRRARRAGVLVIPVP